ncbi:hypothetical protein HAPAU_36810 [Halalkalicoccus paucihalophilus]|uniref:Uncharacterized protein n=1 Tax=Halalkalicoccus paucihalophilus TaxID=1008153 RepID=A0A151A9H7_9EURY|nr:hypothetical protein HAPAU_36810 [Halalkalicoccus paucihalophilus]
MLMWDCTSWPRPLLWDTRKAQATPQRTRLAVVFSLTEPITITKSDSHNRYRSMHGINLDPVEECQQTNNSGGRRIRKHEASVSGRRPEAGYPPTMIVTMTKR